MTKVKHILVLVLTFLAFSFTQSGKLMAHVEKTYSLKGKVGGREIAIKMLCYDEMPTRHINYFFQDAKKDRFLTGNLKGNIWQFESEVLKGKDNAKPGVKLDIAETQNGDWKGTWSDSTGKTWDVVLEPLLPGNISSKFSYLRFVKELDPYESYRLSKIDFIKTKSEKQTKDLSCDWYIEKESGVSFFRLRSNDNKIKTDSINAALETLHLSTIQNCFSFQPGKIDTKVDTKLHYLANDLVSFEILSTNTFKTYNTSKARELITLDVKSGERANLEDIIWLDTTTSKPPADDLFKMYKYRKTVFAPTVFQLLQKLHPDKMKRDSCDINKVETWALPAWALTNKGIALSFNTPGDCDVMTWAIIPYENLEEFMEGKYQLMKK